MEKIISMCTGKARFAMFLFALLALCYTACNKEPNLANSTVTLSLGQEASSRAPFQVTKPWLALYQTNLNLLLANGTPNQSYTTEEAAAGAEALIGIFASSAGEQRMAHRLKKSPFQVSLANSNIATKEIYEKAWQKYQDQKTAMGMGFTTVSVAVQLDSTKNGIAYLSTQTIFGETCQCFIDQYTVASSEPCATAFVEGEGYFAGAGDEDMKIMNFYDNPMCNEGCGAIQPCETGPTTAYEVIEERINFNYPRPTPPSGYKFATWTDVQCSQGDNISYVLATCGLENQKIGTCLFTDQSSDLLNCIFCELYDKAISNESPYMVPPGYSFISLNLGLDKCICGNTTGNPCKNTANLLITTHCWGKPVFKKKIIINNPTTPTLVNLADVDFN